MTGRGTRGLSPAHIRSLQFITSTALAWVTYAWFVFYSGALILGAFKQQILGGDAVLYAAAARAWLTGGNPWLVEITWSAGTLNPFAAPPPSLLPFAPFAFMPAAFVGAFWVAADIGAIALVVRRLRLPWIWCLFPPAIEAARLGNPDPVMLALLVLAPKWAAGLAPILKAYAGVPLVAHRRWVPLAVAVVIGLVTFPFLPWFDFFGAADRIATAHGTQSGGGLSVWTVPVLIPVALVGLALAGPRRAGWLAVPVLWPFAQLHYAAIALPGLSVATGLLFSLPVPGASAIGALVAGIIAFAGRGSGRTRRDTSAGSAGATSEA